MRILLVNDKVLKLQLTKESQAKKERAWQGARLKPDWGEVG